MGTNAVHNQSASSTLNLSCASVAVLLGSKETGISDDVTTTFHMNLTSEFTHGISKALDTSTALESGFGDRQRIFSPPPPTPPPQARKKLLQIFTVNWKDCLSDAE